jgi:phage shock protein C
MSKQLYRSRTNRKIAGVCGGLGEYMNLDPTIIRLIWVLLILCAGTGLLAYLIAALIIPENPNGYQ